MGNIYNGFWINWEHGRAQGATLTLPTWAGLILVSFLTLWVQFSGGCFWRVLCFILHQFRSTTAAQDGLFHQQQTILRNSITAPNALYNLGRICVAWRDRVRAPIKNSLPLLAAAMVHIAFFAAAGLLSSQIASTTVGVGLVRSSVCGFVKELPNVRTADSSNLDPNSLLTLNAEILLGRLTLTKSAAYVRACYADHESSKSTDCNVYVREHLQGRDASKGNTSCPFGGGACAGQAMRFDSGVIDSNRDLGINYPRAEGMSMRRITTCAPIDAEKYATNWVDNLPEMYAEKKNTTTSVKFYEFGRSEPGGGCTATNSASFTNQSTFCVSQYMKDNFRQAYTIEASTAYHESPEPSDFIPIPDFTVPNADVTLISIFNKARYIGQTDDLLFNAQNQSSGKGEFATATYDLAVLGCTEQYQFCNVAGGKCTDLTGLYGVRHAIDKGDLALSSRQNATENIMWKAAWSMALQWACEILAGNLLLAQDWVFTGQSTTSSALPVDQWQLESENLHNLSLAVLQRRVHEFAAPEHFQIRPNLSSIAMVEKPKDPVLLEVCNQQKTRSAEHYSVSVLGMTVILCVGGVLILLDWIFIKQILWFRSFTHKRLAKQADWTTGGTLQLHRLALEARGVRDWDVRHYEAPRLTEKGKMFRGLAVDGEALLQDRAVRENTEYKGGSGGGSGTYSALSNEVGVTYDNIEMEKKS